MGSRDQCGMILLTLTPFLIKPLALLGKGWVPPKDPVDSACLALANKTCGAVATKGHRGECETCVNEHNQLFNETGGCPGSQLKRNWCPPFKPVPKTCEIAANRTCGSAKHRLADRSACVKCVEAHAAELYAAGCPTDGKPLYNYSIELCENVFTPPDPYVSESHASRTSKRAACGC